MLNNKISFKISCRKTSHDNDFNTIVNSKFSVVDDIQKLKDENEIKNNTGFNWPIIMKLNNGYDSYINDFNFKLTITLHDSKLDEYKVSLEQCLELKANEKSEILLFEMGGFLDALIQIDKLTYTIHNKLLQDFTEGSKFVINMKDIQNNSNGFIKELDMNTWYFLNNYFLNTLYHRGYLLKLMITECYRLNKEHENSEVKDNSKIVFIINIQIDIISKIMLYTEDLIVFLIANKENDGFYYSYLDNDRLGKLIFNFIQNYQNISKHFFSKMLGYDIPQYILNDSNLFNDLLDQKIEEAKKLLYKIKKFRDTHIQIFRRYKHAGFPLYINENYVPKNSKIKYVSMIHTDKINYMKPSLLPFSIEFIKMYESLIADMQLFISTILANKIECLERRISGILPTDVTLHNFAKDKKTYLMKTIKKFNAENPIYVIIDQLQVTGSMPPISSPWYYEDNS